MNSSFPNRWSFSYLKFTKYVTNIIDEPKYKHRQQEQSGTTTEVPPWNGQYKNTGGLKPVLQAPNLALSFYHGSKHTVVRSAWRLIIDIFRSQEQPLGNGLSTNSIKIQGKPNSKTSNFVLLSLYGSPVQIGTHLGDGAAKCSSFWLKF